MTSVKLLFNDTSINHLDTDERARRGIFLGMQLPLEIEGVTNDDFLRTALNIKMGNEFNLMPFIKKLDKNVEKLKMKKDMIHRGINQGFSGGERNKNKILQMYMLELKMVLLDEIDSGLDVDSFRIFVENGMAYFAETHP